MKKNCINCGFENASEDKFCRNCGKELIDLKISEKPEEKIPSQIKTELEPSEPKQIFKKIPKHEKIVKPLEKMKFTKIKKTTSDMSKKLLMIAIFAIILSIIAIIISLFIQPFAEIGEETDDHQSRHPKLAHPQFNVGAHEGRIHVLAHDDFARARREPLDHLARGRHVRRRNLQRPRRLARGARRRGA